jgi:hypothetical protein
MSESRHRNRTRRYKSISGQVSIALRLNEHFHQVVLKTAGVREQTLQQYLRGSTGLDSKHTYNWKLKSQHKLALIILKSLTRLVLKILSQK